MQELAMKTSSKEDEAKKDPKTVPSAKPGPANKPGVSAQTVNPDAEATQRDSTDSAIKPEQNAVTSNASAKDRKPAEHQDIDAKQDKQPTPSTSGPLGTEEPGSDEGPGGTGW
jgi:hypothetical protein